MELTEVYPDIQALNAEVVAISVDDLAGASDIVGKVGIPFPVLYDPSQQVPETYKVFNLLGDNVANALNIRRGPGRRHRLEVRRQLDRRPATQLHHPRPVGQYRPVTSLLCSTTATNPAQNRAGMSSAHGRTA